MRTCKVFIDYLLVYKLLVELVEKKCLHKTVGSGETVKTAYSDNTSLHGAALIFHEIPLKETKLFDNWIHFIKDLKHFPNSFVLTSIIQVKINVSAEIL